jgi:Nucleotidyl transferase AbiEii toxin, Type IV TA system
MFTPQLHILPPPQRILWNELSSTPDSMVLYGGTAIALRLGHRVSVDFDFFSQQPFAPSELMASIPYLAGGVVRQASANTLTMSVERQGIVQVSYFGGLRLGQVNPHEEVDCGHIKVASLIDLAGMKAAVVIQRAEIKDYLDIHALLTQAYIPLPVMLSAALVIYGEQFNPLLALKAISYHEDPNLAELPDSVRRELVAAVRGIDVGNLPVLKSVRRWEQSQ